ncbi:hypothetical protein ACOME3_008665 [Neoechinorhynchus agilis]
MSTLDDKLLGIPAQNYCSDSDESDDGYARCEPASVVPFMASHQKPVATNTGPKGVMEDRRLYDEMCRNQAEEDHAQVISDMKKLSLNNPTSYVDKSDEDFFRRYCATRLEELKHKYDRLPIFGVVNDLNADNFILAIDNEHPSTTLLVHIFVDENSACEALNVAFSFLAKKYLQIKFCRFKAQSGVLSETFRQKGCPAIVGYQGGKLTANLVCFGQHVS